LKRNQKPRKVNNFDFDLYQSVIDILLQDDSIIIVINTKNIGWELDVNEILKRYSDIKYMTEEEQDEEIKDLENFGEEEEI